MDILLIAAIGKNRCIGQNNRLPWHLSADLKRFERITRNHSVLMGWNTWNSLPRNARPLPNRRNLILSRSHRGFLEEGCFYQSIEACLRAEQERSDKLYVIGGGQLYHATISLASTLLITAVDAAPEGDTFFPEISEREWNLIHTEFPPNAEPGQPAFRFLTYRRFSLLTP